MVIFSVLYPKSADSTFDMHYYVHTHVPLLQQLLKDFGIGKATVLQGSDALGTPPYEAIGLFEMPTEEALQQALAAHGQTLRNDVPNFTNITPVRQANGIAL